MINTAIIIIVVLVSVGTFFGVVLALADKRFAMEVNPLIHEVEDILPKGQCGACGYAGCAKYAEAVVEDENVPPNLCVPGKAAVAEKVAELTGKKAEAAEPKYGRLNSFKAVRRGANMVASVLATACAPARLGRFPWEKMACRSLIRQSARGVANVFPPARRRF